MLWNIEGLRNKIDLNPDLFEQSDLLLLTETFATTEKQLGTHFVYHSLEKKNQKRGRPSGGLAIAIRKNLNVIPKTKAATDNYLIVELDSKLTVVVMYFKPDTPVENIVLNIERF